MITLVDVLPAYIVDQIYRFSEDINAENLLEINKLAKSFTLFFNFLIGNDFGLLVIEKIQARHIMPYLVPELELWLNTFQREIYLHCIELEYKKANKQEMRLRAGFAACARIIISFPGLAAESSHENRVRKSIMRPIFCFY